MKTISILFISALLSAFAHAQEAKQVRLKNFNLDNAIAIRGYDPVSYFSGKPKEGKKEFATSYEGVIYLFVSQDNLVLFKANPAKYEPAYGGWCAYAMGNSGEKVEIDPQTFKIIEGKNYLFYNKFFTNTLPDWNKMEPDLKKKADENWIKTYK